MQLEFGDLLLEIKLVLHLDLIVICGEIIMTTTKYSTIKNYYKHYPYYVHTYILHT